jgi:hypothetical protein
MDISTDMDMGTDIDTDTIRYMDTDMDTHINMDWTQGPGMGNFTLLNPDTQKNIILLYTVELDPMRNVFRGIYFIQRGRKMGETARFTGECGALYENEIIGPSKQK